MLSQIPILGIFTSGKLWSVESKFRSASSWIWNPLYGREDTGTATWTLRIVAPTFLGVLSLFIRKLLGLFVSGAYWTCYLETISQNHSWVICSQFWLHVHRDSSMWPGFFLWCLRPHCPMWVHGNPHQRSYVFPILLSQSKPSFPT